MQQDRTPTPDVDTFDPDIDPGNSKKPNPRREDESYTDEDLPLPPDVEKREPVREPDRAEVPVGDPDGEPKMIVDEVM